MSQTIELKAETRHVRGKAASRLMRREQDTIPGVIYGGTGKDTIALSLSHKDTQHTLAKDGVFSQILQLTVDGSPEKVIIKALQRHPYKKRILHIDFMRISSTEKLTMSVPIILTGQEECSALKTGGVLSQPITSIEISCLPSHLPESLGIDISALNLGDVAHLSDIKLPEQVELAHPIEDEEHNHAVCSITEPKAQEEEEPTAEATEDGEKASDDDAPEKSTSGDADQA